MKSQWGMIGFEHYKVQCIIGTLEHERERLQEIKIDLKVEADFAAAAAKDHLNTTIDYVKLAQLCEKTAVEGQYHLLEAYAVAVLDKISAAYPIKKAWIRVSKAKAMAAADFAFVELARE